MSDAIAVTKTILTRDKELGDFQTPFSLTERICSLLKERKINPTLLIEPSCGTGNFIISALRNFPSIKTIIAIEIQPDYKKEFYLSLEDSRLDVSDKDIIFINKSFFEVEFEKICELHNILLSRESILVLGNPPWVTNSFLGSLNKVRKIKGPKKTNGKIKLKGLDALTGKSNFDIAESFILQLLEWTKNYDFNLYFLCKTATVQNLLKNYDLNLQKYEISSLIIDAKKEFDISVTANILLIERSKNYHTDQCCNVYSLDKPNLMLRSYGYENGKFVSNIQNYKLLKDLDGQFSYEWRQGLKHDASYVVVLEKLSQGLFKNKLGETVELEEDLIYPLIKSSDLKNTVLTKSRFYVLVTQQRLGQDTVEIRDRYPKTWKYLQSKKVYFEKRKSKIYLNQPDFAMFGIGSYSFKSFKVSVSGFYKKLQFSLLLPIDDKPIMVDDTCYTLSFDSLIDAVTVLLLLESKISKKFFNSIVFHDNKRPYKKDILQRLDLNRLTKVISISELKSIYDELSCFVGKMSFNDIKKRLKQT